MENLNKLKAILKDIDTKGKSPMQIREIIEKKHGIMLGVHQIVFALKN